MRKQLGLDTSDTKAAAHPDELMAAVDATKANPALSTKQGVVSSAKVDPFKVQQRKIADEGEESVSSTISRAEANRRAKELQRKATREAERKQAQKLRNKQ